MSFSSVNSTVFRGRCAIDATITLWSPGFAPKHRSLPLERDISPAYTVLRQLQVWMFATHVFQKPLRRIRSFRRRPSPNGPEPPAVPGVLAPNMDSSDQWCHDVWRSSFDSVPCSPASIHVPSKTIMPVCIQFGGTATAKAGSGSRNNASIAAASPSRSPRISDATRPTPYSVARQNRLVRTCDASSIFSRHFVPNTRQAQAIRLIQHPDQIFNAASGRTTFSGAAERLAHAWHSRRASGFLL